MENAVFLSASVPDPKTHPEFAKTADTVAIAAAVSALLYVTLGRRPLVWGGHPAITPMVLEMCESMEVDYSTWVRLYQSKYFEDEYPEDNERFGNVVYTDVAKDGSLECSLFDMRTRMLSENQFIGAIFIGGKDGIYAEKDMFQKYQPDAGVFPIGSTGGAAGVLASQSSIDAAILFRDLDYVHIFHQLLSIDQREERLFRP